MYFDAKFICELNSVIRESLFRSIDFCLDEVCSTVQDYDIGKIEDLRRLISSIQQVNGFLHSVNSALGAILSDRNDLSNFNNKLDCLYDNIEHIPLRCGSNEVLLYQDLCNYSKELTNYYLSQHTDQKLQTEIIPELDSIRTKQMIDSAWSIIKKVNHEAYKESRILAPVIIVIKSPGLISVSNFNLLGNLCVADCSTKKYIVDYIEAIIHECAHTILFSLSVNDELVCNDIGQTYQSAIRQDPRPMMGIFHAFFVATRVVMFFRELLSSKIKLESQERKRVQKILQKFTTVYLGSIETIKKHAKLTAQSEKIVHECENLFNKSKHKKLSA